MAWSDKPTEKQLGAWYNLAKWVIPADVRCAALAWAKDSITRKQMGEELGRLRDLYIEHKLVKYNCFDSLVWDGFPGKKTYEDEAIAHKEKLRNIWVKN